MATSEVTRLHVTNAQLEIGLGGVALELLLLSVGAGRQQRQRQGIGSWIWPTVAYDGAPLAGEPRWLATASLDLSGQLAAGRGNIVAPRPASHDRQIMGHQHGLKAGDGRRSGSAVARSRKRIEWNQIDLGRNVLDKRGQRAGLFFGVVDPSSSTYSPGDAAVRLVGDIVPAGRQQFGDGILTIERHQLVAQFVVRRVQETARLTSETSLAGTGWHHAGGAESDATLGDAEAEVVLHQVGRLDHVGEIQRGSPMPISTMLVMRRPPLRRSPSNRLACQTWPTISATPRLRLKPC